MIICDRFLGSHIGYSLISRREVLKLVGNKYVPLTEEERDYCKTGTAFYRKGWFEEAIEIGLFVNTGDYIHVLKFNKAGDLVQGPAVHRVSKPRKLHRLTATLRKM